MTPDDATPARGLLLLRLARQAIAAAVGGPLCAAEPPFPVEPWLQAPAACFVTLTSGGRLRGCIGSVRARRPLLDDLRSNARAAAIADPRFAPLRSDELSTTRIEVSVLSPPTALAATTEAEALAALRPGIDGLILEHEGGGQATFLPQVWEHLTTPRAFLSQLKLKAGLPASFWSREIRLLRYTVVHWEEGSVGS